MQPRSVVSQAKPLLSTTLPSTERAFSSILYSIAEVRSGDRRHCSSVAATSRVILGPNSREFGNLEFDSHADTIVFGRNFVQLAHSGRECDVSPYTDTYQSIKNVPIVSAATAWTSPVTGEVYILVFHEGLWMATQMEHSLLNPNQLRHHGVLVQDNPFSSAPLGLYSAEHDFALPFQAVGGTILTTTWTPTDKELQECPHIELTSRHAWDPQTIRFPQSDRTAEEEIDQLRRLSAVQRAHPASQDRNRTLVLQPYPNLHDTSTSTCIPTVLYDLQGI